MISALETVTPPAAGPVTPQVAARHLRLDLQEPMLDGYLAAAVSWAETFTARALMPQTLRWTVASAPPPGGWPLTAFPLQLLVLPQWFSPSQIGARPLTLPRQPVQAVSEVTTGQWGRQPTTLAPSGYDVNPATGQLQLLGGQNVGLNGRLTVEFTAGYANPQAIPPAISQAILLLLGFFYEHRGDDAAAEPPSAVKMLLYPYRLMTFG